MFKDDILKCFKDFSKSLKDYGHAFNEEIESDPKKKAIMEKIKKELGKTKD